MKLRLFTFLVAICLIAAAAELHTETALAYGLLAVVGVIAEIGFAVLGGFLLFLAAL